MKIKIRQGIKMYGDFNARTIDLTYIFIIT
jgi:hypothetical protein